MPQHLSRRKYLAGLLSLLLAACAPQPAATIPVPSATRSQAQTSPTLNPLIPRAGPLPDVPPYRHPARFVFATAGSLYIYDTPQAEMQQIYRSQNNLSASFPAWAPDGKTITYALDVPPSSNQPPYTDIMQIEADGSNPRLLVAHEPPTPAEQVTLQYPFWRSDGSMLYYTLVRNFLENGRFKSQSQEIAALTIGSGQRQMIISNALFPSVDKAGRQIMYIETGTGDVWVAELSNPAEHKKMVLHSKDYTILAAARISPDGTKVVFITAGRAKPSGGSVRPRRSADVLAAQLRDGLPLELWTVEIETGKVQELTHDLLDSPFPAWSADGTQLAFNSGNGLFVINADGSDIHMVIPQNIHGQLDWVLL